FILNEVLIAEGKSNRIILTDTETGSIESQYPNIINLFDYGTIRGYIQLLISMSLIKVVTNDEFFYITSQKGNQVIDKLNSSQSLRIKELSQAMTVLRSFSNNQLIKKIKPFVKGV